MIKVKFYGTRGSAPAPGEDYIEYGGDTTCVLLSFDAENSKKPTYIMVDCGSGASNAAKDTALMDEMYLMVSHPHHDHVQGIVNLAPQFSEKPLHIYGKTRQSLSVEKQLALVMSQPLWPVPLNATGTFDFNELPDEPFMINDVKVSTMESNHPGGCTLFRFDYEGESVVTAFDFNHRDGFDKKLIEFAMGADTIIYDGNMTDAEYKVRYDWGHSTPTMGGKIGQACGAKSVIITHHSLRTDAELEALEKKAKKKFPNIKFAKSGLRMEKFQKVLDIGIALSLEKNHDKLLETILKGAMDITGADGGTLYLLEDGALAFKIMITKSMGFFKGGTGEPINLPPVKLAPENVCASAVLEQRLINIPDVYNSELYDFSGPRNYDKMTGYKTTSVMVVPMQDESGEILGVIQLINATDENGTVCAFREDDEKIIESITSQAAITIENMKYSEQVDDLLYGFVGVMSTGIDARSPYNANHTRNMVKYGEMFLKYERKKKGKYIVSEDGQREILMSLWLHDIGKLVIPLEVMDKNTRLGDYFPKMEARFERIGLLNRLAFAEGRIPEDEFLRNQDEIKESWDLVNAVNEVGFVSDEILGEIDELAKKTYRDIDGTRKPFITDVEKLNLSIRKGTLTDEERSTMQSHVVMTSKMLSELNFPKGYDHVPAWAGSHHEFINGQGYPNHLSGDELPWQVRLITIIDVFEALTAKDRPYKPPMPVEKAFNILDFMVKDGQIDNEILTEFKQSNAWE